MNEKDLKKEIDALNRKRHLESLESNQTRAQSIAIGSSSSGTVEINMRTNSGKFLWDVYQPVEVIEIIYQLAACIGCVIEIQPRDDFASWREWKKPTEEERKHFNGHPPFSNYIESDQKKGLLKHETKVQVKAQEQENVAIKKAVNK